MLLIAVLLMVAIAGLISAIHLLRLPPAPAREAPGGQEGDEEVGLPAPDLPESAEERPRWRGLRRLMPEAMIDRYTEQLLWAGRPLGLDARQFISLKLTCAVVAAALVPLLGLVALGSLTVVTILLAGVAGFTLPDAWLGSKVSDRQHQVAEELPLFADLVAAAISAGLSLTEAVRRVATDAPGFVGAEFLRAVQEMAVGKERRQAWRDLIQRVPGEDIRAVVSAIMQAERYGTSVAEILRYQIQQIRLFKGRVA